MKILDTLKAHNAKANFFVTKMYLEGCGDYARRMKAEGHAVCNHTVHHEDLRGKSVEKVVSEIIDAAEYFYEITGYEFDPYFRTPTGAYTKRLLSIALMHNASTSNVNELDAVLTMLESKGYRFALLNELD